MFKSILSKLNGSRSATRDLTTPRTVSTTAAPKPVAAPVTVTQPITPPAATGTTTTPPANTMSSKSEAFFAAIEARRSYYALTPKSTLSDAELEALVKRAVKFTPTSFNMQHTRAVLVTGEMNQKVWDTIKEIKTKDETEDHAKATADKIDGVFKAGYGTVLFFSETAIVDGWGNQMPPYAEAFKVWDGHASGMLHYNVWTALELEGHGANLQHVAEGAPAIQEGIKKLLGLPETWHNTALLTFGVPGADPQEKTFAPIEERVKVSTGAASA